MSNKIDIELTALNRSFTEETDFIDKKETARKAFDAALKMLESNVHHISKADLKMAVEKLIIELKAVRPNATIHDLELGIKVMETIYSAASVNPLGFTAPTDNKENSPHKPTKQEDLKLTLKNLATELKIKGATWGKVLGVVLIIAGILLSIASFATMIPSFGATATAVPVAVTWTLAGLSFFSTSIGAGLEWGYADTSTKLSLAVEKVAKVI